MMWQFDDVISIQYRDGYVYHIVFSGGMEGDVDLAEYLDGGPIFEPLKDLTFFRQAKIEGGTIAWPNGADIAPETLYEKVKASNKKHHSAA